MQCSGSNAQSSGSGIALTMLRAGSMLRLLGNAQDSGNAVNCCESVTGVDAENCRQLVILHWARDPQMPDGLAPDPVGQTDIPHASQRTPQLCSAASALLTSSSVSPLGPALLVVATVLQLFAAESPSHHLPKCLNF